MTVAELQEEKNGGRHKCLNNSFHTSVLLRIYTANLLKFYEWLEETANYFLLQTAKYILSNPNIALQERNEHFTEEVKKIDEKVKSFDTGFSSK